MNNDFKKNIPYYSLFTTVAVLVGYVEMLVQLPVFIPGMKVGLGNVVIVTVLYLLGIKGAVTINLLKIFLTSLLFSGFGSFMYSLGGGLLSLFVMWIAKKSGLFSVIGISVLGGVFHNIGQLIVAVLIIENINLMYYGLVLLIFGVISGVLVGIVGNMMINRLKNIIKVY